MNNTVEILDQGFACLVENFDYTIWQREYFDKLTPGEFETKASVYAKEHPYKGKAQVL